ncbi:MAG TPA: hypothetical protein VGI71_18140 [Scandinavium sp.]
MRPSNTTFRIRQVLCFLLVVALIFLFCMVLAAVAINNYPDGQKLRAGLHSWRWHLFGWRLLLYSGIAVVWQRKIRPLIRIRPSDVRCRLLRAEILAVLFILAAECISWISIL